MAAPANMNLWDASPRQQRGRGRGRDQVPLQVSVPMPVPKPSVSSANTTQSRGRSRSAAGPRGGGESESGSDDVRLKLSGVLEHFQFPPKLQDPVLASRRYRVVKKLGRGSYGKVYLAWDERRMYVSGFIDYTLNYT